MYKNEMKNSLDELNMKLEIAAKNVSKLEDS